MILSAILAVSENGVIGRDNDLPWRLPDDLKRFKALTMGHPMIMGRKTFDSIGKALPGRTSIVLTRQDEYAAEGVLVARTVDEALAQCSGADEAFVIGGAEVFRRMLPRCHRIYLTLVHADVDGDVRISRERWLDGFTVEDESFHPADDRHAHPFTFRTYVRSSSS